MTEQIGILVKEARLAAGMTQKALAEAVGMSAKSMSRAERGQKELTGEQLEAIAKATGVDPRLFDVAKDEASVAPATGEAASAVEGEKIIELLDAADPAVKKAALSVLKGETPKSKGFLDNILPMVTEMLGGNRGGNPLIAIIGYLGGEEGKAFMGSLKDVLDNFTDVFGIGGADDEEQGGARMSNSLLAFTFFYSVAIYILLLSFYFWQIRTDIKPE